MTAHRVEENWIECMNGFVDEQQTMDTEEKHDGDDFTNSTWPA